MAIDSASLRVSIYLNGRTIKITGLPPMKLISDFARSGNSSAFFGSAASSGNGRQYRVGRAHSSSGDQRCLIHARIAIIHGAPSLVDASGHVDLGKCHGHVAFGKFPPSPFPLSLRQRRFST